MRANIPLVPLSPNVDFEFLPTLKKNITEWKKSRIFATNN